MIVFSTTKPRLVYDLDLMNSVIKVMSRRFAVHFNDAELIRRFLVAQGNVELNGPEAPACTVRGLGYPAQILTQLPRRLPRCKVLYSLN